MKVVFARGVVTVAGCVVFGTASIFAYQRYSSFEPLSLTGTGALRLSRETVEALTNVTEKARENCSMLYSMPGMFSFNFWSGIDTPTRNNATAWMTLISGERQSEIQRVLDAEPRPCIIYHPKLAQDSIRKGSLSDIPLAGYILENFEQTARFGDYVFLEKRSALKKTS